MTTIKIRTSNLSAIAGLNKYQTEQATVEQFIGVNPWLTPYLKKRATPLSIVYDSQTKKQLNELSLEKLIVIAETLGIDTVSRDTPILINKCNIVLLDYVKQCIKYNNGSESKMHLHSLLSKNKLLFDTFANCLEVDIRQRHGSSRENCHLNHFEKVTSISVVNRNNHLYKKKLFDIKAKAVEVEVLLIGQVDGITSDMTTVVETKYRRNCFFEVIPIYEKVQLEGYMYLTGLTKAIHIQNYEGNQKLTNYNQDSKLWLQIIDNVNNFITTNFELEAIS